MNAEEKLLELLLHKHPPHTQEALRRGGLAQYARAHLKQLGATLRQLREARGLSLRGVARRIGVSYSAVGRIERGDGARQRPSIIVVRQLASTYALEIDRALRRSASSSSGDVPLHQRFQRLVMRAELRPSRLDRETLDFVPPPLQEAWLEFAELLEAHLQAGGPGVREMQTQADVDEPDALG